MNPESHVIASERRDEGSGDRERLLIRRAFAHLDAVALGIAVGCVAALGLSFLTALLLWGGDPMVGSHMNRLSFFLIGYKVSWGGAVVGLFWGMGLGFILGYVIAQLWNGYHRLFVAVVVARARGREVSRELQGL
jgi:hypothetical protein